ncbi:hypothetical protein [Paenibacillus periandrae]|uniref:hypothetical protein n=1 Tax=Paenibacillus periandrae TaxID=1761741 RepID=UPI001F08B49A|nr:hypothetical protein [Paenibacillus periandrae]
MKWKYVNAMLRKAEALIDERVSQLNYLQEAAALGSVSVGCFAAAKPPQTVAFPTP